METNIKLPIFIMIASLSMSFVAVAVLIRNNGQLDSVITSTTVPATNSTATTPAAPTAAPSTASQPSQTTADNSKTVYCGIADMPEGACNVIRSIQQNGIKENNNVTFDTSQVPSAAKVSVDEHSWKKVSESLSQIDVTLSALGKKQTGLIYLQLVNGTWKATGYKVS
jgi:hypothetical protein